MKTYKQQFDAITEAYMRDEIKPLDAEFCFCGTLCNRDPSWHGSTTGKSHYDLAGYTGTDFVVMENALLEMLFELNGTAMKSHPNYENALFLGMVAALEVLRQIHLEKGDETAQPITLQKRTLCAAQ